MEFYAKSDVGRVRTENQDAYRIPTENEEIQLFIVADGMGGHNGGKIASNMAVETICEYIKGNMLVNEDKSNLLKKAVEYANSEIYKKSVEEAELEGMGTTIVACLIYNSKLYLGHIGDSRIYRIRKNILRQLTKDHSYVEKLVADGTITREESYTHPKKNMITKALGCTPFVEPDIKIKSLLRNDILVLATDGLTNMVPESKIFKIIVENSRDLKAVSDELISEANNAGGYDNITALIIKN